MLIVCAGFVRVLILLFDMFNIFMFWVLLGCNMMLKLLVLFFCFPFFVAGTLLTHAPNIINIIRRKESEVEIVAIVSRIISVCWYLFECMFALLCGAVLQTIIDWNVRVLGWAVCIVTNLNSTLNNLQ